MRKKAESEEMGPAHAIAASKSGVVLGVAFCDLIGPMKLKTKRGAPHGKTWILILNCVWSRLCVFVPMMSCSAAAVLKAIVTAANMTGGAVPSVLYSDSGSSILPIKQLNTDDTNDTGENLIRDLKTTLLKHKITLKATCPLASHRQGSCEIFVKLFKGSLERCGLKDQAFSFCDWFFICSKMGLILNQRPLSIRYLRESVEVLTPLCLLYGSRSGVHPINFHLSAGEGGRLYSDVEQLDKSLEQFMTVWRTQYGEQLLQFSKWKTSSRQLQVNDLVMILDRYNADSGTPALGVIKEILSKDKQRTFRVEYVQKQARLDVDSYRIIKSCKKASFIRPKQKLAFVTSMDDTQRGTVVNMDPFLPDDSVQSQDDQGEDHNFDGVQGEVQSLPQDEEEIQEENGQEETQEENDQDEIQEPGDEGLYDQDPVIVSIQDNAPEILDIVKNKVKNKPQTGQVKKTVKVSVPDRRVAKIADI